MGIIDTLRDMGGCAGGVTIYFAAKGLAIARNLQRIDRKLRQETIDLLQPLFPELDLKKIEFNVNAFLPSEWYDDNADAMTFGDKIYFKHSNIQNDNRTDSSLMLLMHELVHADQVRRLGGETVFACEYGMGFVNAGFNYENNPLEVEANAFEDANPISGLTLVNPPSPPLTTISNQTVLSLLLV